LGDDVLEPDKLLEDLTDAQKEAVTRTEGPVLVVAGAGSGKTRVITRRVAFLLAQGVAPQSILAITFTNKAANEMKERVGVLQGRTFKDWGRLDQPWPTICTFHSLCLRILRHYAPQLNLPPQFSIYDVSDQERLVKQALEAAEVSSLNFTPSTVRARISDAKNKLLSPQAFAAQATTFGEKRIAPVYAAYQKLLELNGGLDFDDLLMRTAFAFRDHPDILQQLQERFTYLLIDEYQDTNHAQYVIAHLLAQRNRNICVVGDPDQSIYAWRGADIQNILDFESDYPNAKVIRLEQNYRSTQTILDIASRLIAHNHRRKEKGLWTQNGRGERARLLLCRNEHEEAQAVLDRMRRWNEQGIAWSQMAVFYRINALSRVVEDAFRKANVPYRVARGTDFYHRKEIKDVLAYLRVVVNPADALSIQRIINTPARGISDATLSHVRKWAMDHDLGLWDALTRVDAIGDLSTRAQMAVKQFVSLVGRWQGMLKAQTASKAPAQVVPIMEDVIQKSGLEGHYRKAGDLEQAEVANLKELISHAREYDDTSSEGSLEDYLARISLLSDVDALKEGGGAVTLMTLHAAKGLEFAVVAMVGMEEEVLPHARVREHPEQLEEERRLCFVGITRARNHLILARTVNRMVRGRTLPTIGSRFLAEMPVELLQVEDLRQVECEMPDEAEECPADQFRSGQLVRHPNFGIGRIMEITAPGPSARAVVLFNSAGRKTLVLQYANLEPVG
jgi:DNA helicase-2/ATP-dependent DNA helicase PcrA